MPAACALLALAAALLLPSAPARASTWHSAEHSACLAQAAGQPEAALQRALKWEVEGGGAAAIHCVAVALIGLGSYAEAAKRLEALVALVPDVTPDAQAALLAEAGHAWLLAEDTMRAISAFDAAIKLVDDSADLYIDRSLALVVAGDLWAAIDDLNRAEDLAPERVEVLVFRATAYRYLETWELAAADLERALALDPDYAEAYLERGVLRRELGDKDGARQDWLMALRLEGEGPTADAARMNLEEMDLKVED